MMFESGSNIVRSVYYLFVIFAFFAFSIIFSGRSILISLKIKFKSISTMVVSVIFFNFVASMFIFALLTSMIKITEVRIRFCVLL